MENGNVQGASGLFRVGVIVLIFQHIRCGIKTEMVTIFRRLSCSGALTHRNQAPVDDRDGS
jgi:hypothetical protein